MSVSQSISLSHFAGCAAPRAQTSACAATVVRWYSLQSTVVSSISRMSVSVGHCHVRWSRHVVMLRPLVTSCLRRDERTVQILISVAITAD